MFFAPILAGHGRFTIVGIYLQRYFLNKVDGRCVCVLGGGRPESPCGFHLFFLEQFFYCGVSGSNMFIPFGATVCRSCIQLNSNLFLRTHVLLVSGCLKMKSKM